MYVAQMMMYEVDNDTISHISIFPVQHYVYFRLVTFFLELTDIPIKIKHEVRAFASANARTEGFI